MLISTFFLSPEKDNRGPASLFLVTVLVGAGGMLGQLLLLRELLVVFYGNELTMGIILSNWLLLEAAGAWVAGKKGEKLRRPLLIYKFVLLAYALLLPLVIVSGRSFLYSYLNLLPGETAGIVPLFLSTIILLGPLSFFHGALFPLGCLVLKRFYAERFSAGKIYTLETLGTLLGGVVFTFLLAGRYHSLEVSMVLILLHLLAILFFLNRESLATKRRILHALLFMGVLFLIMPPFSPGERLHDFSLARYWEGQEVLHYENSPHGNIVTIHSRGEYTFFYDGRPLLTIPNPDKALIADFVHIGAASHPQPGKVLLIGSGLGGVLDELFKHPIREVFYAELDPHLPRVVEMFPTPLTKREFSDPRLNLKSIDGRLFLARTSETFDLVLLGFITPETLQTNRLFTIEFFALVKKNLAEGGKLVFSAPGSEAFMGPEMAALNSSLYQSAEKSFEKVRLIPGDQNIFIASSLPNTIKPERLWERLEARGLTEGFISESYLEYRLDPIREEWALEQLRESNARPNYDLNPAGFYYALLLWGRAFAADLPGVLAVGERATPAHYFGLLSVLGAAVLVLLKLIARKSLPKGRSLAFTYALWSSGVAGMAFDLLVLFIFQSLYGYVYQMIGLLMASFMAGTFGGGAWGVKKSLSAYNWRLFLLLEGGIILLLLSFFGFTVVLQSVSGIWPEALVISAIAAFALISGFAVGAQFPLAAAALSSEEGKTTEVAGALYTADLLGGFCGGLLISIFLFPLLGLWQTLLLLGFLKLISLVGITAAR